MEEEKKKTPQMLEIDKALTLLVPRTEPSEPVVKPKSPPEGYTRKLVGRREGGELFETMLTPGTDIFELATPITLLAECEVDKLKLLGIEVRDVGGQYILETNCIVDTGADISCTTNEVREALGRAPLTDANGGVTGVGGVHKGKEKVN